jgi:hypothetical protein
MYKKIFLALSFSVLLLAACSKVNQTNFDKIQNDMTKEQVLGILGAPTETSQGEFAGVSGGTCIWKSKDGEIEVHFFNDKVISKNFSKGPK